MADSTSSLARKASLKNILCTVSGTIPCHIIAQAVNEDPSIPGNMNGNFGPVNGPLRRSLFRLGEVDKQSQSGGFWGQVIHTPPDGPDPTTLLPLCRSALDPLFFLLPFPHLQVRDGPKNVGC